MTLSHIAFDRAEFVQWLNRIDDRNYNLPGELTDLMPYEIPHVAVEPCPDLPPMPLLGELQEFTPNLRLEALRLAVESCDPKQRWADILIGADLFLAWLEAEGTP